MGLTVEEWNALSDEERAQRADEKPSDTPPAAPEVKEDVVIIDGKPRPLKNFVAEITRKVKEDIEREMPPRETTTPAQPPVRQPGGSDDFYARVVLEAEQEMERTGRLIPVETIMGLISQGSQYHAKNYREANRKAQKVIKETKRELKNTYKNYGKFEEQFEDLIDGIEDPRLVTKDGLKVLFNSLRGQNLDGAIEEAVAAATKRVETGKTIIGDVTQTTTTKPKPREEKLTESQAAEMKKMNFESEDDYIGRLKKYQALAARRKAKNVPQTLSERLIFE